MARMGTRRIIVTLAASVALVFAGVTGAYAATPTDGAGNPVTSGPPLPPPTALHGPHPLNAGGCHGNVCISVQGSGIETTKWSTTVQYVPRYDCINAVYYWGPVHQANNIWDISATSCAYGGQWGSHLTQDVYWSNQTELCNVWWTDNGNYGEPCITVHN